MSNPVSNGGKPAKKRRTLPVRAAIAAAVGAFILCGTYLGLCFRAKAHEIPFHTYVVIPGVAEPVDVGGMKREEAEQALTAAAAPDGRRDITVLCGDCAVSASAGLFELNEGELLERMETDTADRAFLLRGWALLGELVREPVTWAAVWSFRGEGEDTVDDLLERLSEAVDRETEEPVYTLTGDCVRVTLGSDGREVDVEAARTAIQEAFLKGETVLELIPLVKEAAVLTAEELNRAVYRKAEAVPMDERGNILDPVTGRAIDIPSAQTLLDAALPGGTVEIPLVSTPPDYAAAEAAGLLYQDLLSECVTQIGGSAGRLTNVALAAEKCDGVVLLPGDTFDYNRVVGQRTVEAGFQAAPAYFQGQTVQEVGGGICQVSSSLYYCAVYANLEIVTRINHRYAVSYLPEGLDATVSWGGPEFRFRNDSLYPVRISAQVEGRELRIQFYGTDPKGIYVETERSRLSTTGYAVIYEPDETVPVGTTVEKVSPYVGRRVEVWRCVYAADGTLLSRTKENTSQYSHRDQVIRYHPADGERLGLTGGQRANAS